jgi:hypothetical protein
LIVDHFLYGLRSEQFARNVIGVHNDTPCTDCGLSSLLVGWLGLLSLLEKLILLLACRFFLFAFFSPRPKLALNHDAPLASSRLVLALTSGGWEVPAMSVRRGLLGIRIVPDFADGGLDLDVSATSSAAMS